jgi:hypothetical protein
VAILMRKIFYIFPAIFFAVCMGGQLFAEVSGPTQAGEAASVEGEVKATTPPEKAAHLLKDGDPIFMGDKIETGVDGNLQIQLLDQTVFTLGPLSTVTIDEFVYDPGNAGGKAGMVKGVFRAVSGKVSGKSQENAAETEALLNDLDELDRQSQDPAQRTTHNAQRSDPK